MNVAVLGAGMIGRAIAADLSASFRVKSFDISEENLDILQTTCANVDIQLADLKNYSAYTDWLSDFDIVVSAVPGAIGYKTLEALIEAGKNVADISFFHENALELDKNAKTKHITVITDIGVAPGISNLIAGRYNEEMKIKNFECYVGGLPKDRQKPFEYKAPFSPADVIEEYIRPARLKVDGAIITKPALSEIEEIEFDGPGKLEAFNTDGLRSLLFTMPGIPNMKEKTLRYPGHADLIIKLKEAGFFNKEEIQFKGIKISPLEFSSRILFDAWKLNPGEEEMTVMRIVIDGVRNNINEHIEFELIDTYDMKTKTSSMGRSTGYTCTAAVHLIAKKLFVEKGVFPPELVGRQKPCFDFVMGYLKERGVNLKRTPAG